MALYALTVLVFTRPLERGGQRARLSFLLPTIALSAVAGVVSIGEPAMALVGPNMARPS